MTRHDDNFIMTREPFKPPPATSHLPHERHEGARELAELALLARGLKQELAFHEAVMAAGEKPELAALKAHPLLAGASENSEGGVAKILEVDEARLAELGVDSTPVAWIDGYRVTGQRDVAVLQRFVDLALAD